MHLFFSRLKSPEWIFVIIALLAGSVLGILIPNQSGFDEQDHLARIWEISGGYFVPNQRFAKGPYLPLAFTNLSYRNQFFYNTVDPNYFTKHSNERIDWNIFTNYTTRDSYIPIHYFPQAFMVGLLARIGDAPVLFIFYILRAMYLLGYILLTFFAIRLIPFGKWLLAVLALAPMAMFQASTISPDAYTNGACFLFLAWVLRLGTQEQRVNWRQLWITIGIVLLLLSVKLDAAFLLPLLLLLVWKGFESKKMLPILAGVVIFLFALLVVGWNLLAYTNFYQNAQGYGILEQLNFIVRNPIKFGTIFLQDIARNGPVYLRNWVATYGYGNANVPSLTYPLFILALVTAWFLSPSTKPINGRTRALMILTGVAGYALTVLTFYLTLNPTGSVTIGNVQGRHFIPMLPALFLGLVPNRDLLSRRMAGIASTVLGAGTVLALVVYTLGIYLSFYVVCGASLYTPGICYQPRYKNWAPNDHSTPVVTNQVVLQQTFTPVCTPLRSLRVWSTPASQNPAGETQIALKDPTTGAVLFEQQFGNQTASDHAWQEFSFQLINNTKGKQFMLEISSAVSDPAAGLLFGVSERREYLSGIMINNSPAQYDLLFQYGCQP